ncbi:MAG: hypothetical protein GX091_02100 [Peptococcaceae bacterium]|nr:hypothetical protein [Peptococcaceae bacterium]
MDNLFPKCEICSLTPSLGLYDGFRLRKKFVCAKCEEIIIKTAFEDSQYQVNIQNIKRIIFC